MSEESLNPERDELWAKHDGLTPACCAEMIVLAGKLEQERNVWKHEAEIVRKQLDGEHEAAIDWFIAYQELKDALIRASNELGIPQPGYPAPVANAANILKAALAKADSAEPGLDSENARAMPPATGNENGK